MARLPSWAARENRSVCSSNIKISLLSKNERSSRTSSVSKQGMREKWWRSWAGYIVDSRLVVPLTTVLTLYALTGDDIRLLCTPQSADYIFDSLTITCLAIFTLEIILSTLGKDDYFLGFFFLLDVVSTATLILDLTAVNDIIQGDEDSVDSMKEGDKARFTKLSRVVRVIRLVRIMKLYKAILVARQARRRRLTQFSGLGDDDDDWNGQEAELRRAQMQTESRVSKKLTDVTTRRVIILVLTMMVGLPYLELSEQERFPSSANYGADIISEAFKEMQQKPRVSGYRTIYENRFLQYIYYHNWFDTGCPPDLGCSKLYDSHIFWFGIVARDAATANARAQVAALNRTAVETFEEAYNYTFGTMPKEVQSNLGLPWNAHCPSAKKYRLGLSLLKDTIEDQVIYTLECPDELRRVERKQYTPRLNADLTSTEDWHFVFYFDARPFIQRESMLSLILTAFVSASLTLVSITFSNDANRLVLYPVENMISKVDTFRRDPLAAIRVADEECEVEAIQKKRAQKQEQSRTQWIRDCIRCRPTESASELMETVVLEKTIIKLGSLLALGFGEAGANIIAHNLRGADSASVVVMVEGTKVDCIIGSTRIRDFTVATEVLQGDVMAFVNRIAEIVHGVADEFHGAANKNSGDTFLTIWRTSDKEEEKVCKMADMAVLAFTRILGAVHRSPVLAAYRRHPGLQQRLGKNCRVNLSSGLHYGWAIEGAVGSEFKIDASYLSPNVNIAENVERATQVYDVSILVTESVIHKCTPSVGAKCRLIDRVVITGSKDPMELYVIDLDFMSLMVEQEPPLYVPWTSRQRFRVRQFLESEKAMKWHSDVHMLNFFNEHPDIATMRFRYTLEFLHVFDMGYQNYTQGEWRVAERLLSRTRTMLGVDDGPSNALLNFMGDYRFAAPESWEGIWPLDQVVLA